jgi:hypothetical protein
MDTDWLSISNSAVPFGFDWARSWNFSPIQLLLLSPWCHPLSRRTDIQLVLPGVTKILASPSLLLSSCHPLRWLELVQYMDKVRIVTDLVHRYIYWMPSNRDHDFPQYAVCGPSEDPSIPSRRIAPQTTPVWCIQTGCQPFFDNYNLVIEVYKLFQQSKVVVNR